MAGSTIGTIFKISTWGESHGPAIGVVIDGCPAGLPLSEADIQPFLDRRRPGRSRFASKRTEDDRIQILSGTFEGKTTGTPISLLVYNHDQNTKDYTELSEVYRPGHADYTYEMKYGIRDYRGGGRASGRETVARVAAGAVAVKLLEEFGVTVSAYTKSIGPAIVDEDRMDLNVCTENALYMPDAEAASEAEAYLNECMEQEDSAGGVIECVIDGLPAGLGEPVFDKLSANLGKAVLSIGGVKGFEIGDGFAVSGQRGSEHNDPLCIKDGSIIRKTNHAGGITGGISDGGRIIFRAAIKPTPSIGRSQITVDRSGRERELTIAGRHDPVIVPRAVVVVEAMAALTIADALLVNASSRVDYLKKIYG